MYKTLVVSDTDGGHARSHFPFGKSVCWLYRFVPCTTHYLCTRHNTAEVVKMRDFPQFPRSSGELPPTSSRAVIILSRLAGAVFSLLLCVLLLSPWRAARYRFFPTTESLCAFVGLCVFKPQPKAKGKSLPFFHPRNDLFGQCDAGSRKEARRLLKPDTTTVERNH